MSTSTEKASHTPGPWEPKRESDYVPAQVWADGRQLAEIYGESRVTRVANARLIAAAPEMLEALERVVEVSKTIPAIRGGSLTGTECRALEQAETAIRHARGES